MTLELTVLLKEVADAQGSDIHLVAGQPPIFRINGALTQRGSGPVLDSHMLETLLRPCLDTHNQTLLETGQDVLLTVRHGEGVFRLNVFREQGRLAAAIRVIPTQVPTLEELGLTRDTLPRIGDESVLQALTKILRGLIIVAGSTGSGKSTLAAALIEEINQTRSERILTIECPTEYVFQSKKSVITQRGVGEDIADFPSALRSALYSDPDVVFVAQSVDLETLMMSLSTANTGHLVFTVLHVDSATEAIRRIIEVFPEGPQQTTVRRLLAQNLVAVIVQKLLPRKGPRGRIAVQEILTATPRIRQMILDGQEDFTVGIEAGRSLGMQTMDDAVAAAYERGDISYETALFNVSDRERIPPPVT